jgi:hypothetical protein
MKLIEQFEHIVKQQVYRIEHNDQIYRVVDYYENNKITDTEVFDCDHNLVDDPIVHDELIEFVETLP